MPELCRFYGSVIRMYFEDHYPPHFHACYGEAEILIRFPPSLSLPAIPAARSGPGHGMDRVASG